MAFTRYVVRMKVAVTRVEHIFKGTVDHICDGEGYGIIFKIEGDASGGIDPKEDDSSDFFSKRIPGLCIRVMHTTLY
jgi:hypothetical protein